MNIVQLSSAEVIRANPCVKCYLCGQLGDPLFTRMQDRQCGVAGEWTLRRCSRLDCGLVWLDPCPIRQDVHKLYTNYYTHSVAEGRVFRSYRWLCRAVLSARLGYSPMGWGNRFIGRLMLQVGMLRDAFEASALWQRAAKGKLLDVGCGSGSFLQWMRELGWQVVGIEPDPNAATVARSRGIDVQTGTLEQGGYGDDAFDLITLSHVLEHLDDPIATFKECWRTLKPGGRLVVVTPNSTSLGAKVFGQNWFAWESPRHFMLFNINTIRELARRTGFKVTVARTSARMAWWTGRLSDALTRHPAVPNGRCPFEPWVWPSAIAFHCREHASLANRPVGEELVLVAEKPATE